MTVRVKICGLTRRSDVELAIDSGADALGFIFGYPSSPRNLDLAKLKELLASVPPFVSTVVVSPESNPHLRKASELKPSFLQLYDDSSSVEETNGNIFTNVIQTVRPSEGANSIVERCVSLSRKSVAILLDMSLTSRYSTDTKNGHAMSLTQNLALAKKTRMALDPFPLIVGGGLTVTNVAEVVRKVRPYAVDVSTGVEKGLGIKDDEKVAQFIQNAKSS